MIVLVYPYEYHPRKKVCEQRGEKIAKYRWKGLASSNVRQCVSWFRGERLFWSELLKDGINLLILKIVYPFTNMFWCSVAPKKENVACQKCDVIWLPWRRSRGKSNWAPSILRKSVLEKSAQKEKGSSVILRKWVRSEKEVKRRAREDQLPQPTSEQKISTCTIKWFSFQHRFVTWDFLSKNISLASAERRTTKKIQS